MSNPYPPPTVAPLAPQTVQGLGNGTPEPADPFRNAYNAAVVSGEGGDVVVPAGVYYINDPTYQSVFQLARDNARTAAKIRVVFDPGVTIRLSALTPRVIDVNLISPFDWFRNTEFVGNGCIIDANNIAGRHHCLFGSYINGAVQAYWNYELLKFSGFRIINLYTDATDGTTNLRHGIWLSPLGNATTDTYGLDVECEDIDIEGGNGGITLGNAGAGSRFHWDRMWIRRCKHDRGLITENYGGANSFYIGSRGIGGQGGFEECYSRGAGDTGYEINGPAQGYITKCVAEDSANNGFLHRGANGGIDPGDPGTYTAYTDCITRKVARTGTMRHIKLGVDTAGDFNYGTVVIRGGGCAYQRTDSADLSVLSFASPAVYGYVRIHDVTLELQAGPSSANTSGANLITSPVYLDNGAGQLLKIRGLNVILSGSVGVGAGISRRIIDARGGWRLDIEDFNIDDSQVFTGGTPALRGVDLGNTLASGGGKSLIWGRIDKMRYGGGSTIAATAILYGAFATQGQVSGHPFEVTNLDCGDMAAGSVPVSASGTNLTQIKARRVIPRGNFAFPTVASAAALTLPAYDVEGEIITITGVTGVTSIAASWAGRVVHLSVTGACTFTDNGTTLNLAGNFVGPGMLTLWCDGTNWSELGRSNP